MTGYASAQYTPGGNAEIATPAACLALELRSVNSRFLDVVLRLPDELRPQEPALRELIAKRLKRGKVELRVSVEAAAGGALPDVPVRTLQRLAAAQQQVRVWLPEAAPLSVADALRLAAGDSAASPALGEALLPLARQALDELVAARQREGARLLALLQERITALRALPRSCPSWCKRSASAFWSAGRKPWARPPPAKPSRKPRKSAPWPKPPRLPSASTWPKNWAAWPRTWTKSKPCFKKAAKPASAWTFSFRNCTAKPIPSAANPPRWNSPASAWT